MATYKKICSNCKREIDVYTDPNISYRYCPYCGKHISYQEVKQDLGLEPIGNHHKQIAPKNRPQKSNISDWWQPICFISGFLTICYDGPITNLIGWPILLYYVHYNASASGKYYAKDTCLTIGGVIIWVFNLILLLSS